MIDSGALLNSFGAQFRNALQWSVVFHCLQNHAIAAHGTWSMTCQAMKNY